MADRPNEYPEWAIDDVEIENPFGVPIPNKIRPSQGLINEGYKGGDRPAANNLNYQLNNIYKWISYLDQLQERNKLYFRVFSESPFVSAHLLDQNRVYDAPVIGYAGYLNYKTILNRPGYAAEFEDDHMLFMLGYNVDATNDMYVTFGRNSYFYNANYSLGSDNKLRRFIKFPKGPILNNKLIYGIGYVPDSDPRDGVPGQTLGSYIMAPRLINISGTRSHEMIPIARRYPTNPAPAVIDPHMINDLRINPYYTNIGGGQYEYSGRFMHIIDISGNLWTLSEGFSGCRDFDLFRERENNTTVQHFYQKLVVNPEQEIVTLYIDGENGWDAGDDNTIVDGYGFLSRRRYNDPELINPKMQIYTKLQNENDPESNALWTRGIIVSVNTAVHGFTSFIYKKTYSLTGQFFNPFGLSTNSDLFVQETQHSLDPCYYVHYKKNTNQWVCFFKNVIAYSEEIDSVDTLLEFDWTLVTATDQPTLLGFAFENLAIHEETGTILANDNESKWIISKDYGLTWEDFNAGIPPGPITVYQGAFLSSRNGVIYITEPLS